MHKIFLKLISVPIFSLPVVIMKPSKEKNIKKKNPFFYLFSFLFFVCLFSVDFFFFLVCWFVPLGSWFVGLLVCSS